MNFKIVFFVLGIFAVLLVAVLFFFIAVSPGSIKNIKDSDGSILKNGSVKKLFIEINGIRHGMFISMTSEENPVLLFIHGGPGMPEYFMHYMYPTGLEKHFTICWMEQRGAGLSYSHTLDYTTLDTDDLLNDIKDVSEYLKDRYHKEKIFLAGHSWGTYLGLQAAASFPELFSAYIAIAQITDQKESELIAFDYMKSTYLELGNTKKTEQFNGYSDAVYNNSLVSYMGSLLRDESMHELGIGSMRSMKSVITGIFLPSLVFPGYTVKEKLLLWKAKSRLHNESSLRIEQLDTDLSTVVRKIEIPIIFMSGKYDYTVNWELSKEYFNSLEAPRKEFLLFENSAHSPLFEERERYVNEMHRIKKLYE